MGQARMAATCGKPVEAKAGTGVRELSHWPITTAAAHLHDSDTPGRDT